MKKAIVCVAILMGSAAHADEHLTPAEIYVSSAYFQQVFDSYISHDSIRKQLRLQWPVLTDEQLEKATSIVREEYSREIPKMKEIYADLISDVFTDEELKALNAFMASPAGQAFVQKTPTFMTRGDKLVWPLIENAYQRIDTRFRQEVYGQKQ